VKTGLVANSKFCSNYGFDVLIGLSFDLLCGLLIDFSVTNFVSFSTTLLSLFFVFFSVVFFKNKTNKMAIIITKTIIIETVDAITAVSLLAVCY
jgi:hypothetical protein